MNSLVSTVMSVGAVNIVVAVMMIRRRRNASFYL